MPTIKEIHNAEAGTFYNIICCPLVSTIGLLWRSLSLFCFPCIHILCFRCIRSLWVRICCCFRWPYVDKSFEGAKALGNFKENDPEKMTGEEMENVTDWIRAHELISFKGKRPQLFEGKIEPDDLCQGAVGDCWLVASFVSASEYPSVIRRMFINRAYNPRGLYKIRIFDPIKRKYVKVIVDDRIPCDKNTKTPRFMKPNGSELWAILLEKAYAKYCGSYAALEGGFVLWGWHSMTGDNVFQMTKTFDYEERGVGVADDDDDDESESDDGDGKKKKEGKWAREDMVPIVEKTDKRACGFNLTDELFTDENLWTLLKKYDHQKALLSASIGKMEYGGVFNRSQGEMRGSTKKKNKKGNKSRSKSSKHEKGNRDMVIRSSAKGINGETLLEKEGLIAGHAYSILQVIEMGHTSSTKKLAKAKNKSNKRRSQHSIAKLRLLNLRNPWGTFEWTGDWSDKSELWASNPSIRKNLHQVYSDDGSFWMSYDDFLQYFTRVNICDRNTMRDDWELDVNEDRGSCGIVAGWCGGCLNFWCGCKGVYNLYCGHRSSDKTLDTDEEKCCTC